MVSSFTPSVIPFVLAALVAFPVFAAASPEIGEVVELLRKIHPDQCQRHQLRGQVLVAHREHDQKRLNALYPELDAITRKLKPDENRIKALTENLSASDQDAFESAQLSLGSCD
jgi:hypothetical protein